jgi:single-strand DNA-binding protein
VAVNRRKSVKAGVQETDYFKVTAWEKLAAICGQYLSKGAKVAVTGSVSVSTYESKGNHYASLDVTARDVEFLGRKSEERSDADDTGLKYTPPVPAGFVPVDPGDDLPF